MALIELLQFSLFKSLSSDDEENLFSSSLFERLTFPQVAVLSSFKDERIISEMTARGVIDEGTR